jgi:PAS domain S-box-containing protein
LTGKPTYEALALEVEALRRQSERLLAVEGAVQRHNDYLTALHETALDLIEKLDAQELLQTILVRAMALTGTAHGYIYLCIDDDQYMQMQVGTGIFEAQVGRRVAWGEGLGGQVRQQARPIVIDDYRNWPGRLLGAALDPVHCAAGIPLMADQRVRGVIGLAHLAPERRFDAEDVRLLERFAALAMLALEKGALYKEVRHELSERRKAEAAIRASEQRYRNFLESSPDPIVVYDMDGSTTYVNPAFEQTFGMPRQEILGQKIDFVPPEAWPETQAAIGAMLEGKKINLFETRRLMRDGRTLDVQLSSCLYTDEAGRHIGNIVTLRDISDRKRAERALRNYQDQLEGLVQARTTELNEANRQLGREVEDRKRAEEALLRREVDLQAQSQHLEEVNTALRVLLQQRVADKNELQKNVLKNVKELVLPYLDQLQKMNMNTRQQTLVRILASNLNNIVSPFINRLSSRFASLTPTEMRIATLVKDGKTNKEIADLMIISRNTVLFHRHNIRKKLKLTGTAGNLRSHLLTLEE